MKVKAVIFSILRILVVSVLMCAVLTGIFYLYSRFIPEALDSLHEEGNMDNTIWAVEYFTPMLTILIVVAALYLVYKPMRRIPISLVQTEKGYIWLVIAVFTYAVILPYVLNRSIGCFDPVPEGEQNVLSLLEKTATWFIIQIIPLMLAVAYHFTRAKAKDVKPVADEEKEG